MTKLLLTAILFAMTACGQQSSPEGRLTIRDKQIQAQINRLEEQHKAMQESIDTITSELKTLKK